MGEVRTDNSVEFAVMGRREVRGWWRESKDQRGLLIFFLFVCLVLKEERYIHFPDEVKEVETQVLTRPERVWRMLILITGGNS